MKMSLFLAEFDKKYNRTKAQGTTFSDDALAYKMLKAANLHPRDQKMIKFTIGELNSKKI